MTFELPYPPSVNTYWRTAKIGGHCRTYISERGKKYREKVIAYIREHFPRHKTIKGRISMSIFATMPDKRSRDLDNLCKAVLDSLEAAEVFENDEQIDELLIRREGVDKPGWVTIMLEEL